MQVAKVKTFIEQIPSEITNPYYSGQTDLIGCQVQETATQNAYTFSTDV